MITCGTLESLSPRHRLSTIHTYLSAVDQELCCVENGLHLRPLLPRFLLHGFHACKYRLRYWEDFFPLLLRQVSSNSASSHEVQLSVLYNEIARK